MAAERALLDPKIEIAMAVFRLLFRKNHNLSTAIFGFLKNGSRMLVILRVINLLQRFYFPVRRLKTAIFSMERQTIAANFWVAPSKVRRNGLAPINATITRNGQRASFSTGRMIRPENWDSRRQRAKGKSEEAIAINTHLQQISIQLQQKEDDLISKGYIITADLLRDAMLGKIDALQSKTLMQLFDEFIADRRRDMECGKIAKDTFENNNRSANYVREFIRSRYKRNDVALHELNHSFIANFDTFLRNDKAMKKKHLRKVTTHAKTSRRHCHCQRLHQG